METVGVAVIEAVDVPEGELELDEDTDEVDVGVSVVDGDGSFSASFCAGGRPRSSS